jgi:hypothetical protein
MGEMWPSRLEARVKTLSLDFYSDHCATVPVFHGLRRLPGYGTFNAKK